MKFLTALANIIAGFACFSSIYSSELPTVGQPEAEVGSAISDEGQSLSCEFIVVDSALHVGDTLEVLVLLVNTGKKPIHIVHALDHSQEKTRYPHVYFEVEGPNGGYDPGIGGYSGTRNLLRTEHFIRLPPGASITPYFRVSHSDRFRPLLNAAGKYTFTFHYSTDAPRFDQWIGPREEITRNPEPVKLLLREVPLVNLSCSFSVEVQE